MSLGSYHVVTQNEASLHIVDILALRLTCCNGMYYVVALSEASLELVSRRC